ncbi:hypothetical protein [Mesorhizobium sp. IMUNJ 23232]|uniref:hypothetical protein n=1 Tax=Mesorhizobium sp. IMUNJ 23232 TaxID=3376064 RepID=UPI00378A4E14
MVARQKPVFINCPFDAAYLPFFHAIAFTVSRCGFKPRCALEVIDSGGTRIAKIEKIIEECPLGIHDISRTELGGNGLPRFNMPLELGLFLGAKRFGDKIQARKRCLVLDTEPYRYQIFMSDIAGQDIEAHGGKLETLIGKVRSFLNAAKRGAPLPSGAAIAAEYKTFQAALPGICSELKVEADRLEFKDFVWAAAKWMSVNATG